MAGLPWNSAKNPDICALLSGYLDLATSSAIFSTRVGLPLNAFDRKACTESRDAATHSCVVRPSVEDEEEVGGPLMKASCASASADASSPRRASRVRWSCTLSTPYALFSSSVLASRRCSTRACGVGGGSPWRWAFRRAPEVTLSTKCARPIRLSQMSAVTPSQPNPTHASKLASPTQCSTTPTRLSLSMRRLKSACPSLTRNTD
mmetsp:Transcript_44880/g.88285  ORF Transcript_44880/g.88285 Transcript_44880/m.88285 type:complete len:205 (+) Transcript_44880:326-940(+)